MAAAQLQWVPESLYNTAVSVYAGNYSAYSREEIKSLPNNVLFDVIYKFYHTGRLCELASELSHLDIFSRLLEVYDKRRLLHHSFQVAIDHGRPVNQILEEHYRQHSILHHNSPVQTRCRIVHLGLNLGLFLNDAGWYYSSEPVLKSCLYLCHSISLDFPNQRLLLAQIYVRLLNTQWCNSNFAVARNTWSQVELVMNSFTTMAQVALLTQRAGLWFQQSYYSEALQTAREAMALMPCPKLSPRDVLDVFRISAKCFAVKRKFTIAGFLIQFALQYAKQEFGPHHHKYAECLMDQGYYLVNVDQVKQAVEAYQSALDVRISCFGGNNFHVANTHEDLAYSMYVYQYSSGHFQLAENHADTAIRMMSLILPPDHLSLASSKRVKALIVEEVAIDTEQKDVEERLLREAHELHMSSLELVRQTFGESNVQTAKHYGNLGRLFQSMHKYQEAEAMHLKAIQIKEEILGPDDYEVALSVGHLASLYNYDMAKYKEAEPLYLRSIEIGRRLFGEGYSGLEYDYRGLIRLYSETSKQEEAMRYRNVLHDWARLRERTQTEREKTALCSNELLDMTVEEAVAKFKTMDSQSLQGNIAL